MDAASSDSLSVQVKALTPVDDPDKSVPFLREIIGSLRKETEGNAKNTSNPNATNTKGQVSHTSTVSVLVVAGACGGWVGSAGDGTVARAVVGVAFAVGSRIAKACAIVAVACAGVGRAAVAVTVV